jgi:glutamate-1-semialdehyde 2,1-aminomutase
MTAANTGGTTVAPPGHNSGKRCTFEESTRRIRENSKYLAGGVSSNFRLGISPTPLVFDRGEGACLYDVDGNRLIDYYLGMGPMILGHNPPA